MSDPKPSERRVAALNDQFRRGAGLALPHGATVPGLCVITSGIADLARGTQAEIFERIRTFSDFQPGNDPYGEHDFGSLATSDGESVFWKINYYADKNMEFGSETPEDPNRSFRVLTIMLAAEY